MALLILREEIICAIILLFLILYYFFNKIKDKEMLFLKLALVALAHLLFDIATVITVNHRDTVPEAVNRLLHIGFYATGLLFSMQFYNYIAHITTPRRYSRIFQYMSHGLLLAFAALLFFLPMEYVDGRGTDYSYGPLAFVGYSLFLLYCTACLVRLFSSRKTLSRRVKRSLLPMLAIMYTAVILQAIFPELLITGGNVTLICISLFVSLDNPDKDFMMQALWDFPTGLKNRNCYNRDLAKYTVEKSSFKRIGFLVADLNYLKTVNDNYGHAEGDKLIAAAANTLREHLKSAENVYRVGGDEFTAVYLNPDDQKVAAEMERMKCACANTSDFAVPLSIAIGYASGPICADVTDIFEQADQQMYEHKLRIKQEAPHLSPSR